MRTALESTGTDQNIRRILAVPGLKRMMISETAKNPMAVGKRTTAARRDKGDRQGNNIMRVKNPIRCIRLAAVWAGSD